MCGDEVPEPVKEGEVETVDAPRPVLPPKDTVPIALPAQDGKPPEIGRLPVRNPRDVDQTITVSQEDTVKAVIVLEKEPDRLFPDFFPRSRVRVGISLPTGEMVPGDSLGFQSVYNTPALVDYGLLGVRIGAGLTNELTPTAELQLELLRLWGFRLGPYASLDFDPEGTRLGYGLGANVRIYRRISLGVRAGPRAADRALSVGIGL